MHSTANLRSTAWNERGWLTNPTNTGDASYHIVIDEKNAIECIPLNESSWNATDGYNGTGNRKYIAIEMCESGDREKVLDNTVTLVAKMLKQRGWKPDRLRRHYDFYSAKKCPRILNYNDWEGWRKFVFDVGNRMKEV